MRRRLPFWPSVVCIWIVTGADLAKADAWLPRQSVPDPARPGWREESVTGRNPEASFTPSVSALPHGGQWRGTPDGYVPPLTALTGWRGSGGQVLLASALTSWKGAPKEWNPGPLGIAGAGAGWLWCRRLRKRVAAAGLNLNPDR